MPGLWGHGAAAADGHVLLPDVEERLRRHPCTWRGTLMMVRRRSGARSEDQGERSAKNYAFVDAVARKNVELTIAEIRSRSAVIAALETKGAIDGIVLAGSPALERRTDRDAKNLPTPRQLSAVRRKSALHRRAERGAAEPPGRERRCAGGHGQVADG